MLVGLLPDNVSVIEAWGSLSAPPVWPEEQPIIERAVPKRQREFAEVRSCARAGLRHLGYEPVAILSGEHGEPIWPAGVVGSMTHCDGYRATAVAHAHDLRSVGIDAEPDEPLPSELLRHVAAPDEVEHLRALSRQEPSAPWGRLLFSAKEAVYKTWFPLTETWLDFKDVQVEFFADSGRFTVEFRTPPPPRSHVPPRLVGAWARTSGYIGTAVHVGP